MKYQEYAGQDKIVVPATNYPEPKFTTAYEVFPRSLIHAQRLNSVAAKIAEIVLQNLDNPTPVDIRKGIEKFLEVQKLSDKYYAAYRSRMRKKSGKSQK